MRTLAVEEGEIPGQADHQFAHRGIAFQIHVFVFDVAPESLDKDVVKYATTISISVSRGRAQDEQTRSSGAIRACGQLTGKIPPPSWPQAQTMEIRERVLRGEQELWARVSRIDTYRSDAIL